MSSSNKPVFLSYASQDVEATGRICDAMQRAGLEVWFDRSELRGGDAWDQKIRTQIKECALFVPIISANTQARPEGYFRLEWLLAVERSRLMADDEPFILPVVVDDTPQATARVPERFRDVQWTRLRLDESPGEFANRARSLLERGSGEVTVGPREAVAGRPRGGSRRILIIAAIAAAVVLALVIAKPWRQSPGSSAPASRLSEPATEGRRLVDKARALYEPWDDASREDFALAEQMVKKAIALDESDGEAWAAYGVIACGQAVIGYDRSAARREIARMAAARAMRLAPDSHQARFAQAFYYRLNESTRPEADRMLRELVATMPTDKLVLRTLGNALRAQRRFDDAIGFFDRAAALPGGDPVALFNKYQALIMAKRYPEAEKAINQALALKPTGYLYRAKASFVAIHRGDLDEAAALLAKLPAAYASDVTGAYWMSQIWLWRREPDKALKALSAVAREIGEGDYSGPISLLTGLAHDMAGRKAAARTEWQAALRVAEQQLMAEPNSIRWIYWQARVLALLDRPAEATRALVAFEELVGGEKVTDDTIPIYLLLGRSQEVMTALEKRVERILTPRNEAEIAMVRNHLRFDPAWDSLRGDVRFESVLRQLAKGGGDAEVSAKP